MTIELNKETGKVEMDLETYLLLTSELGGEVFSSDRFRDFIKSKYKGEESLADLTKELGVNVTQFVCGRSKPDWRMRARLIELFDDESFIVKLPHFSYGNPWDLNIGLLKNEVGKSKYREELEKQLYIVTTSRGKNVALSTITKLTKMLDLTIDKLFIGECKASNELADHLLKIKEKASLYGGPIFKHMTEYTGLTDIYIGQQLGVSGRTIGNWRTGMVPTSANYFKMCQFFGVPLDFFEDWLGS